MLEITWLSQIPKINRCQEYAFYRLYPTVFGYLGSRNFSRGFVRLLGEKGEVWLIIINWNYNFSRIKNEFQELVPGRRGMKVNINGYSITEQNFTPKWKVLSHQVEGNEAIFPREKMTTFFLFWRYIRQSRGTRARVRGVCGSQGVRDLDFRNQNKLSNI